MVDPPAKVPIERSRDHEVEVRVLDGLGMQVAKSVGQTPFDDAVETSELVRVMADSSRKARRIVNISWLRGDVDVAEPDQGGFR